MLKRLFHALLRSVGMQASLVSPLSNSMSALCSLLRENHIDLIFDIGANVGQYSNELVANGYRGHIVSFEPLSDEHRILLEKSQNSPYWDIAERCCIGDRSGSVTLQKFKNSQASSVLPASNAHAKYFSDAHPVTSETAPMYRFDEIAPRYMNRGVRPYLKVDVQGFEEEVLAGARETMPKLFGLQVELSLVSMYDGQKLFSEMVRAIEEKGFDLYFLMPAARLTNGRWLQADCVFFRSTP
jgi:FkbM family methyltransferase